MDQTKVDGPFTRCVERDNLMKLSASRSHQDAIWTSARNPDQKLTQKLCGCFVEFPGIV